MKRRGTKHQTPNTKRPTTQTPKRQTCNSWIKNKTPPKQTSADRQHTSDKDETENVDRLQHISAPTPDHRPPYHSPSPSPSPSPSLSPSPFLSSSRSPSFTRYASHIPISPSPGPALRKLLPIPSINAFADSFSRLFVVRSRATPDRPTDRPWRRIAATTATTATAATTTAAAHLPNPNAQTPVSHHHPHHHPKPKTQTQDRTPNPQIPKSPNHRSNISPSTPNRLLCAVFAVNAACAGAPYV
ncbi:hypothetical protein PLEOSDRAFT_1110956 [Pleurotus ostreatus PC15]|uniref:Uncharacterized protein n=1 Tax=Pleurotus ostreatus (strain PC15) TaxID=1137138 RepID=A0A067NUS8_PLEO1|nr:hypothetical protein PLEOSDRAFT_1110956 [Pleurotus ostreatus PC15]